MPRRVAKVFGSYLSPLLRSRPLMIAATERKATGNMSSVSMISDNTLSLAGIINAIPEINVEEEQKAVNKLVEAMKNAANGGKKRAMRQVQHIHPQSGLSITSWIVSQDWLYSSKPGLLPTMARGLFTRDTTLLPVDQPRKTALSTETVQSTGKLTAQVNNLQINNPQKQPRYEILVRGYDKFFNIDETKTSTYKWISENTQGPYEVSVKENGCILFVSGVSPVKGQDKSTLIVTSKHSLGGRKDVDASHAQKGEEWLYRHLDSVNRTADELASFLATYRLTAVYELADDDFEEHILAYPPDKRGLYLHGLNLNTCDFHTLPSTVLDDFAHYFGTRIVKTEILPTLDTCRELTDRIRDEGEYDGRAVEGFVVRTRLRTSTQPLSNCADHMFKVKYDEPYLMFREWREVTVRLLAAAEKRLKDSNTEEPNIKMRYPLTTQYVKWVRNKMRTHPQWFNEYRRQKGIIFVRDQFLLELGINVKTISAISQGEQSPIVTNLTTTTTTTVPELIKKEENQTKPSFNSNTKILFIPIAVIGAGKTTLGKLLKKFFPDDIYHIQNDDISFRKSKSGGTKRDRFNQNIINAFNNYRIVLADRNNHLHELRTDVVTKVKQAVPNVVCVALHWDITGREQEAYELSISRVQQRGEFHQSLTPSTPRYEHILSDFIYGRHKYESNQPQLGDRHIDTCIELDIFTSTEQNLMKIVNTLNSLKLTQWKVPSVEDLHAARCEIQPFTSTQGSTTALQSLIKNPPRYFGIQISTAQLTSWLNAHLQRPECSDEFRRMWTTTILEQNLQPSIESVKDDKNTAKRMNNSNDSPQLCTSHHVTLVYCNKEALKNPKVREIAEQYKQAFGYSSPASSTSKPQNSDNIAKLAVVRARRIIWDNRVVVIPVEIIGPESNTGGNKETKSVESGMDNLSLNKCYVPYAQQYPHITVSLFPYPGVTAAVSNELLKSVQMNAERGVSSWHEEQLAETELVGPIIPYKW